MSNLLDRASILLTPTAVSDKTLHSVKPIQTFGSEIVVNGDFADNSTWTTQSSVTFTNGTVIMDSASQNAFINQNILTVGRKYRVSITVEALSIVNKLDLINASGITYERFGVGVNVFDITANQSAFRIRTKDGATSTISNASVIEITDGDFDLTRATTATRVGPNGLIQSVASGLPRIDFTGGTGQVLLEPASTNTATYSNDFSQGDIFSGSADPSLSDAILTANQGTAPDGTNTAQLLKDDSDGATGQSRLNYFAANVLSGEFNTASVFAKKYSNNDFFRIEVGGYDSGFPSVFFNIQNGTLGNIGTGLTAKIEDYGNGWYRCSVTFQTTTDLVGSIKLCLASANGQVNVTRDGTNEVLLFGLQAEADASRNFATSYIPTSGGTVTRNKDEANNGGDSTLINSTQGVLYVEIAALANDLTERSISLTENSGNRVTLQYRNASNAINVFYRSSNVNIGQIFFTASDITQFSKLAYRYKENDFALFVDGVRVGSVTSGSFSSTLSALSFDRVNSDNVQFFGKVKSVAVFKEALDNDELECLTGSGFDSFTALAEAGSYTII